MGMCLNKGGGCCSARVTDKKQVCAPTQVRRGQTLNGGQPRLSVALCIKFCTCIQVPNATLYTYRCCSARVRVYEPRPAKYKWTKSSADRCGYSTVDTLYYIIIYVFRYYYVIIFFFFNVKIFILDSASRRRPTVSASQNVLEHDIHIIMDALAAMWMLDFPFDL